MTASNEQSLLDAIIDAVTLMAMFFFIQATFEQMQKAAKPEAVAPFAMIRLETHAWFATSDGWSWAFAGDAVTGEPCDLAPFIEVNGRPASTYSGVRVTREIIAVPMVGPFFDQTHVTVVEVRDIEPPVQVTFRFPWRDGQPTTDYGEVMWAAQLAGSAVSPRLGLGSPSNRTQIYRSRSGLFQFHADPSPRTSFTITLDPSEPELWKLLKFEKAGP